jgi:DUF1680 family protein
MLGRVALQRGPLVYCLEGADNALTPLDRVALPENLQWQTEHQADLLGGVTMLRATAQALDNAAWSDALYRTQLDSYYPVEITAIPYCVWDNRAPGEMRVWLRQV